MSQQKGLEKFLMKLTTAVTVNRSLNDVSILTTIHSAVKNLLITILFDFNINKNLKKSMY